MTKNLLFIFSIVLLSFVTVLAQDEDEIDYLFQFPLPAPSDAQIQEAYDCELPIEADTIDLTPSTLNIDDMSACELAIEAIKLAVPSREAGDMPDAAKDMLVKAITGNPAMAQKLAMLVYFFGKVNLVSPPDFTDQPITQVKISYGFFGLGNSVAYDLTIDNADSIPVVSGDIFNDALTDKAKDDGSTELRVSTLEPELLQAFAPALRDWMPIGEYFNIINCFDYYPDWEITLTFEDETEITLTTDGSNIIGLGGPYQTTIDEQAYMQHSAAIEDVLIPIFEALELPFGQTQATTCGGIDDPIFSAFPPKTDE